MNIRHKLPAVMTSREFNQDTARAKRAAREGPVVITERGDPVYVLMTMEEFEKLKRSTQGTETKKPKNLAEALADDSPEGDFDFEPPRLCDDWGLRIPTFD